MEIVKDIRDNTVLRASFNALAEKTFGLNFEGWLKNGYWTDNYRPYCAVENGRVLANVSVNRTDMLVNGKVYRLIQLGTVMTDESCRNQGLIRAIMAEIDRDCADADGMYLFGSDSVVNFYPKFGFVPGKEYICSRKLNGAGPNTWKRVPMQKRSAQRLLEIAIESSRFQTGCAMLHNPQLILFYVSQFMQDNVIYQEDLRAWCIVEAEGSRLFIHNVFGPEKLQLDDVLAAFGSTVTEVTLGFSPVDPTGWTQSEWHREDCNFFVRGGAVQLFAENRIRIPELSHA